MDFKSIHPDNVNVGMFAQFTFLNSIFKVVEINYRGIDKDNLPYVGGYVENAKGFKMSFSYKESYSYLTFFNPLNEVV